MLIDEACTALERNGCSRTEAMKSIGTALADFASQNDADYALVQVFREWGEGEVDEDETFDTLCEYNAWETPNSKHKKDSDT